MVRRGSTVRVRQRALQKSAYRGAFLWVPGWNKVQALEVFTI